MAENNNRSFLSLSLGNVLTIISVLGSALTIYVEMRLSDAETSSQLRELNIEMCEVRVVLAGNNTNEAILSCRDRVGTMVGKGVKQ